MLDPHLTGTEAECEAYLAICDKSLGFPLDSEPWGGGRHAPMKGRTGSWTSIDKHPDREEYAVKILPNAPTGPLTVLEAQAMGDAERAAVELDGTWKAKEAEL